MHDITLIQFLIVCPLVGIAGFVDAVAGGGGLISLPAYMLAGVPVHNAIATNKLSSLMGTTTTAVRYFRDGFMDMKIVPFCVAFAFCGSACGARIALMITDRVFKLIMLVLLPLLAAYLLKGRAFREDREPFPLKKTILIASAIAFVVGAYDGFYGPGTGTFLILLLTAAAHISLENANGTSKAINLSTNVAAFVVYTLNGKVLFPLGLVAGLFGIAGNQIGSRMFEKGGAKIVKPMMLTVLAIFFIKLLTELF